MVVRTRTFPVDIPVLLELRWRNGLKSTERKLDGLKMKIGRLRTALELVNTGGWPQEWSPGELVRAAQVGNRLSGMPQKLELELDRLSEDIRTFSVRLDSLRLPESVRNRVRAHLIGILPGNESR